MAKMLSEVLYECTKNCQLKVEPSYVTSSSPPVSVSVSLDDKSEEEKMDADSGIAESNEDGTIKTEPEGAIDDSPKSTTTASNTEGGDITPSNGVKLEPELDKENINKSAMLESNSARGGMISAAS